MSDTQGEDTSYADQFQVDILEETSDTEGTGGSKATSQDKEDYKTLQAQILALQEQNNTLLKNFTQMPVTPAVAPQKKQSQELDAATLEHLGKNPAQLASFVNQKIESGMDAIQKNSLKTQMDQKVYQDFPALQTNKQFNDAVRTQMGELVANGEYDAQHPMLVYRAAQLAANKLSPAARTQETRTRDTSVAPSSQRGTTRGQSSGIKNNDPRLAFAVAAGIKDPTKLARFKKDLEQNYGPTDEHMQKRGQLRPRGRTIGGR